MLDKWASQSTVISIHNPHATRTLTFWIDLPNGSYVTDIPIAPGGTQTYTATGSGDLWCFGFFGGSGGHSALYGDFEVKVDTIANLVAPPAALPVTEWALLAESGQGHLIEDEGTPLAQRPTIDVRGAALSATDDAAGDQTVLRSDAMIFRGAYDAGVDYKKGSVVTHSGKLWVAAVDLGAAVTPGSGATDNLIATVRGVKTYESDRLASASYVTRSITAASDTNDIATRKGKNVLIDRTGSSGHTVTIKNLNSGALTAYIYDNTNFFLGTFVTGLASGGQASKTIGPDSGDEFICVYFNSGPETGDFEVKTTNGGVLVAPPVIGPSWTQIATV